MLLSCSAPACVQVDSWWATFSPEVKSMERNYPHLVPVDLGDMGYEGEESIYLSANVLKQALDAEGLSLDYYRGCPEQASAILLLWQ